MTNAVSTRDNTNSSRGSFDLISKFRLSFSVVSEVCVAVAKNSKMRNPTKYYAGYFSIPLLKIVENNTTTSAIRISGYTQLHRIPRKLLAYFRFNSLLVSSHRTNQYCFMSILFLIVPYPSDRKLPSHRGKSYRMHMSEYTDRSIVPVR